MKKMIASLIICLLLTAPAFSESSVWVAQTDSSTLYLGGTIHLLRASDLPFPPEFDKAYEASSMLVFEIDPGVVSSPELQQALVAKATYGDGRTLDSVLSPEVFQKLNEFCTANGLPFEQLKALKPWTIAMTMLSIKVQKIGATSDGVDVTYYKKAKADEKPIGEVETMESQVEKITTMGDGYEDAFLLHEIEEFDNLALFDSLANAWKAGDEETLTRLFVDETRDKFPELYKKLFVERNMEWLPKIEKFLLTPETEFVLVGTGHLVGDDGVIALLKKLGYKVEKLK